MTTSGAGAALSHVGKVRSNNQDSGYSGHHLFVVADGMGGHAGGDVASAMALNRIIEADEPYPSSEAAEATLQSAILAANSILGDTVSKHRELTGMGTTVSALAVIGNEVAIAHIGDSRIYLFREGELSQITVDHTFVQRLVDSGRITAEEAMVHPRRSVLMRVLGDVDASPEIDTMTLGTQPGDRWILCSDGLSGVVDETHITATLTEKLSAQRTAEKLVRQSLDRGAPDNVTVVVVDIVDEPVSDGEPVVVGSASKPVAFALTPSVKKPSLIPNSWLHPGRVTSLGNSHFEPASEDYLDELIEEDERRARRRRITWLVGLIVVIVAIVGGVVLGYAWTQTRYFVGGDDDTVVIYQGIQQDVGPIKLSNVKEDTGIPLGSLSDFDRQAVDQTISASSFTEALDIVKRLRVTDDQ
ncbi:Stp1/IreP family PP2C-type Ser/Thr phosphatase [Plantibacter sp. PA-3-X8]|uniref:Protein phosphatase n=1 Tax=Plantibacter cousiniae (nom. nud.) TaxID=199709 RepID=A0ABY1LG46_9MICO|nr:MULTISPECIES: Stp1/IreP family PP2C-type Ser/Thr phosphatase [Plantibacter]AZH82119.1 Stp1/IreP family PP2C-type Ser/Thr phosphatase [Plantibacter sp. PA-3-X8]TKJ99885.1 Stp1/IreP family PP2C-type Ser/Thr phosphatase [Plantibacter flavus]SKC36985.1 protein phosphatase [Plantibacter cousiniae]VXB33673.1 Stp1/IreP family PP2C-type Ser/Thr phosphatase [Plantibacter sp. T3]